MDKKLFKAGLNHFLDVSTSHITERDGELLTRIGMEANTALPLFVSNHPYGHWVDVHPDIKDQPDAYFQALNAAGFSQEFCDILRAADEIDCIVINFDADGLIYEGLPQFEW